MKQQASFSLKWLCFELFPQTTKAIHLTEEPLTSYSSFWWFITNFSTFVWTQIIIQTEAAGIRSELRKQ